MDGRLKQGSEPYNNEASDHAMSFLELLLSCRIAQEFPEGQHCQEDGWKLGHPSTVKPSSQQWANHQVKPSNPQKGKWETSTAERMGFRVLPSLKVLDAPKHPVPSLGLSGAFAEAGVCVGDFVSRVPSLGFWLQISKAGKKRRTTKQGDSSHTVSFW